MSKKNRDKDKRNERNADQNFNQQQRPEAKRPEMMNKFEQQRPEMNRGEQKHLHPSDKKHQNDRPHHQESHKNMPRHK